MKRLLVLAATAVLLALAWLSTGSPARAEPFRVGTWKTAQTIQPFFYEKFLGPGAQVKVSPFTNPADQKAALLAGSLELCGTTLVQAIVSASRGEPVVLVASMCGKASALVTGRESGIVDVAGLRGKRIGYVPGTMHEVLLREALAREGLAPERDVRLVRVDFFDMAAALARGGIDAFLSGEPLPTQAELDGYGRIIAYPYYEGHDAIGTVNAALMTTRDLAAKRRERIVELVRAHSRATEFLNSHQDVWLEAAAAFGTPRQVLERAAGNIELTWSMDEGYARRVRALGARMKALGMIEREPDYGALIDFGFVRAAGEGR